MDETATAAATHTCCSMWRHRRLRLAFVCLAAAVVVATVVMHLFVGDALIDMLTFDADDAADRFPARADEHVGFVLRNDPGRGDGGGGGIDGGGGGIDADIGPAAAALRPLGDTVPLWKGPAMGDGRTVAIGCAITTRGQRDLTADKLTETLPFFRSLVATFCNTATRGFDYHFYVAHDHIDPYFARPASHNEFRLAFHAAMRRSARGLNATLHLVECSHDGRPAWAQNDAMMAAYMDNRDYYYRVNDDTAMLTSGWTERFISQLEAYDPPNVGVAGPWFRDGNTAILTHDFVHRTHIDVFGYYYPRVFTDWFADDWITGVYSPGRCRKVPGTAIRHTMERGVRYVVHYEKASHVRVEVEIGRSLLRRYLDRRAARPFVTAANRSRLVISLSIGEDDSLARLYGSLRYAQLVPVMFPGWRVRVYVGRRRTNSTGAVEIIARKLANMDAEVVQLDANVTRQVAPPLWRFLIADDAASVDRFLIRSADTRPSDREAAVLDDWLTGGVTTPALHCVRDHPNHTAVALTPSLIGGVPAQLRPLFSRPWRELMVGYASAERFLSAVVWPHARLHSLCHDSVSCQRWPGARPFPVLRQRSEFVGRRFDVNDQPVGGGNDDDPSLVWNAKYVRPECVFVGNTGFDNDTVRSVIRRRPVFWSQDYHVTPIMDVKSLLAPIGVRVIDKSLSYDCASVGTCASGLRVLTRDTAIRLTPDIKRQFYEAYRADPEMSVVTTFICTLPVAMCEAFVAFNRSMLVIATVRYEQARPEPEKWRALNAMLRATSRRADSVVAANNLYDARYMHYFTGIQPLVIPPYCAYLKDAYRPTRRQFLSTPIHSNQLRDRFFQEFDSAVLRRRADVSMLPLRQLYPQYLFSDLAAHPGIVYIPYQVSMASLTEQYRMNIPLFFPTLGLLAKWHLQYQVVRQRTWGGSMGRRTARSGIAGDPAASANMPDPNNEEDEDAVRYWLRFADFYQWPHIIYFASVDDLVEKMATVDLDEISRRMAKQNREARRAIKKVWSRVLMKLTEGRWQ